MNYLELMAAFNTMKTKLLAHSVIEQHIPKLNSIDRESYLKDHRFFNPLLTTKENAALKIQMAKVTGYKHNIICGNILHSILFKESVYAPKGKGFELQERFSILGITLYNDPVEYKYKFYKDYFVKKEHTDGVIISKQQFDYSPFYFKEAYSHHMMNRIELFGKYISSITAESKDGLVFKFRRGITIPETFKLLVMVEGPYAVQMTEEGFNVWPG